jgi:hypothetical protein
MSKMTQWGGVNIIDDGEGYKVNETVRWIHKWTRKKRGKNLFKNIKKSKPYCIYCEKKHLHKKSYQAYYGSTKIKISVFAVFPIFFVFVRFAVYFMRIFVSKFRYFSAFLSFIVFYKNKNIKLYMNISLSLFFTSHRRKRHKYLYLELYLQLFSFLFISFLAAVFFIIFNSLSLFSPHMWWL